MKFIPIVMMFLLTSFTAAVQAAPVPAEEITGQLTEKMSVEEVNRYVDKVSREMDEELPQLNAATIKTIISQGITFNWQSIKTYLKSALLAELAANSHLMGKLLFLAVLCALLQNLQNSFEQPAVSMLAYSVCHIFLLVLVLTAFYNALTLARTTVDDMLGFIQAMLPLMITLLAGVGAVTSAAMLSPLLLTVLTAVCMTVNNVVLPLLFLAAVLQCVNFFSDRYQLSNLAGLFRQAGMVILGLALVAFVGIITAQGVAGGISDGIALRAAKYATATFIPVVGKMFADTVELVMGASLLVKNAVGLFGIITVFTICIFPLVKLAALVVVMKLTGALTQPLGDDKMAKCLDVVGDNLLLVFGGVVTVALMFFLSVVVLIGVGSLATTLR
jgi:stage III sporulation protein AE